MGHAFCGKDSQGRNIGYGVRAVCDFPGCTTEIDRGMDYACGGSHGTEDLKGNPCCEGYFCEEHLNNHNCPAEIDDDEESDETES